MQFLKSILIGGFILHTLSLTSQEDDLTQLLDSIAPTASSEPVIATFKTTRLINLTTIEQVKRGELDFRIAHRFGDIAGNAGGASQFFGFDNVSDIRFSFDYGLTDHWQIGIGRSKGGGYGQSQVFDLNTKYKIKQQSNNGFPLAISAFGGLTFTSMESNHTLSSTENFDKTVAHRFNYFGQILFARKINDQFSVILAPTIVHRNLVNLGDNNTHFAIAVGARAKISKRVAIIGDYYQVLNVSSYQKDLGHQMPIGLGLEIETGGHVFHALFSTNTGIMESQFLPNNTAKFTAGQVRLGFNISRIFTVLKN
ncbi:MAG: DUF5777 family beta-barrel protein [Chitinophagales bacterium]